MVQIEKITKQYGRGQSVTTALSNLSLSVAEGEALAMLGANGAGKSTVIQILSTLIRPDSGNASIAGFDVVKDAPKARENIGVALQEVGLYPAGRVRQTLLFHARLFGMNRNDARRRSDEVIELIGLERAANRRAQDLSGGMRRRLDVGLALIHRPPVLLLDEPTTGLDPVVREELWIELARLRDLGTCILLATQNVEEAERLADYAAILTSGRISTTDTALSLLEAWPPRVHATR